jgi:riboflavin synthase
VFTGLVQAVGRIVSPPAPGASGSNKPLRLLVDPGAWQHRPGPGDSIAVSGCCLTLAAPVDSHGNTPGTLAFDVVPETLAKTCLGALLARPDPAARRVNLEHAVTASTLMGGHFVQGHVDGVGQVERVTTAEGHRVRVRPPPDLMPYLAPKGSICIDGVSLTIAGLGGATPGHPNAAPTWFEVALIPATLELTTLADLAEGDPVNLEADILAKTIVHYLRHFNPPRA